MMRRSCFCLRPNKAPARRWSMITVDVILSTQCLCFLVRKMTQPSHRTMAGAYEVAGYSHSFFTAANLQRRWRGEVGTRVTRRRCRLSLSNLHSMVPDWAPLTHQVANLTAHVVTFCGESFSGNNDRATSEIFKFNILWYIIKIFID